MSESTVLRFASFSAAFFVLVFATTYYVLVLHQSGDPLSFLTFQTQDLYKAAKPVAKKALPAAKNAETVVENAKPSVENAAPVVEKAETAVEEATKPAAEKTVETRVESVEASETILAEQLTPSPQPSGNYTGYTEPVGKFKKHKFRQGFSSRFYHSYLGKNARANVPHQTVVLLHGSGRTGISQLDMWKETADLHNLYLIAPDSYNGNEWSTFTSHRNFFHGLIDHAGEEALINKDQVYLFGHASGGRLATKLAAKQALPFRAIATHAGFENADNLGMVELGLPKQVPISFYLGEDDHLFKVDAANATANKFVKAGHDVRLFVIPDHTHWYYSIGPQLNKLIWAHISQK